MSDLFAVAFTGADPPVQVLNAASYFGGSVAPGEIVSLFGAGIGPATPAGLLIDGSGLVATSLNGVRVLFDSTPAPLLYAGPNQINLVVPYEVGGNAASQIQIDNQGQLSPALPLSIVPAAPAIFAQDGSGQGPGAVLNQDGSLNSPSNPAAPGSIVSVFATGAGQMNPPAGTGTLAGTSSAQPLQSVSAMVGTLPAQVQYAGPAPGEVSGVFQVNLQIPAGAPTGDSVPVVLIVGDGASQPGITISIH